MAEKVIELEHLQKQFGDHAVLRDINLSVEKGEVLSIIGASGSGKSTMLRCINLLETPTSGRILYHGKDISDRSLNLSQYRTKVGMVFQSFNLFNNMTALNNCVTGQMSVLKRSRREAEEVAMKYLTKVGMAPYIHARPAQLSGGQKQRVAIAGVLAMQPRCVVLDEPTAMLDPVGRREVVSTVTRLCREKGMTVMLITHHMNECIGADRLIVMSEGRIVADGTPREVFSQVELLRSEGLAAPATTQLIYELRHDGYDLPLSALTVSECADAVMSAI